MNNELSRILAGESVREVLVSESMSFTFSSDGKKLLSEVNQLLKKNGWRGERTKPSDLSGSFGYKEFYWTKMIEIIEDIPSVKEEWLEDWGFQRKRLLKLYGTDDAEAAWDVMMKKISERDANARKQAKQILSKFPELKFDIYDDEKMAGYGRYRTYAISLPTGAVT